MPHRNRRPSAETPDRWSAARLSRPAFRHGVAPSSGPFARLSASGFPMVRRVEPGAVVARGERLKNSLDSPPGRGAAEKGIRGHPLFGLKGRAVITTVDVHGHDQA